MTKRFILLFTALAFVLAGCDKDDGGRRNKAVEQTLYQLYPDASHLDWDYDGNYVVVDFRSAIASDSRAAECEAWFDYNGSWYLTEFDIRFNELPAAVINAFNSSAYGSWYVEDVERIDRAGYASVYIIQVEDRTYGNDVEYDLYYNAQGILIKEIADGPDFGGNYGDFLPPTGSDYTAIREFIKNKYPNGQIVDIEFVMRPGITPHLRSEKNRIQIERRTRTVFAEHFHQRDIRYHAVIPALRHPKHFRLTPLPCPADIGK